MTDADVIVVGAGIVGCSAVREARRHGVTVAHLAADEEPHSLAAAAITRPTYLAAADRRSLPAALENHGPAVSADHAYVTSYRTPDTPPKPQKQWWLIDPRRPLFSPDVHAWVTDVDSGRVTTSDGTCYTARAVILATGAGSDLSPPGKVTWGTTWLAGTSALVRPDVLRIHHWSPYKAISAGPAGGLARVGSSSGKTREAALEAGYKLLDLSARVGLVVDAAQFHPRVGARLQTEHTIQRRTTAVYWAGGHHRNGYALGPRDGAAAVRHALKEAST